MMSVLARSYRPKCFDEIVGQAMTVRALSNAFKRQRLHHAYLFAGTRGVGKTTIARIVAKCLNCEAGVTPHPCQQCRSCSEIDSGCFPDVLEIDAASRTKVEDTRELLDNVPYSPAKGRYKVYLIDEVHMLSTHSFNALLKTLEEPPEHVIFLLATTDYRRLPLTILSRCLQFHLQPVNIDLINQQLQDILLKEKIDFDPSATYFLSKVAEGSLRDALSLLDQAIVYNKDRISEPEVRSMLGVLESESMSKLIRGVHEKNAPLLFNTIESLSKKTTDFTLVLKNLLETLHELAVLRALPTVQHNTLSPELMSFAQQISAEDLQLYYQIGLIGQRDLPYAPSARSGFEMTLLRMMAFTPISNSRPVLHSVYESSVKKPSAQATRIAWDQLCSQIEIDGAAKALAQECQLKKQTCNALHLILDIKHRPLLSNHYTKRLEQAISKHLKKPMQVIIELGEITEETPAGLLKRRQAEHAVKLEKEIMSDDKVQKIVKLFDATIVKDSIN